MKAAAVRVRGHDRPCRRGLGVVLAALMCAALPAPAIADGNTAAPAPATASATATATASASASAPASGPTAAVDVKESAVQLDTGTGRLAGTLVLPTGAGPTPALVIVSGSGPTDRDGNSAVGGLRNDSLKQLAAGLARQGIASLRYDKRGVGASRAAGPSESDLRFDHYVQDAAGWLRLLAADPRFSSTGLVGHSEGALIAMLAAQQAPAASLVAIASPAAGAADVLAMQLAGQLPPDLAAHSDRILKALREGRTTADVPAALAMLYRPSVQPYLISWFARTPSVELARLSIPRLVVQGDTDIQVATDQARQLHAACGSCELRLIGGMNHVLKAVGPNRAEQLASYGDPSLPVVPELVASIAEFVRKPQPQPRPP